MKSITLSLNKNKTKKRMGKITGHYLIINKDDPTINLKDQKGEIQSETSDRIEILINGKSYNLPKKIVKVK